MRNTWFDKHTHKLNWLKVYYEIQKCLPMICNSNSIPFITCIINQTAPVNDILKSYRIPDSWEIPIEYECWLSSSLAHDQSDLLCSKAYKLVDKLPACFPARNNRTKQKTYYYATIQSWKKVLLSRVMSYPKLHSFHFWSRNCSQRGKKKKATSKPHIHTHLHHPNIKDTQELFCITYPPVLVIQFLEQLPDHTDEQKHRDT